MVDWSWGWAGRDEREVLQRGTGKLGDDGYVNYLVHGDSFMSVYISQNIRLYTCNMCS